MYPFAHNIIVSIILSYLVVLEQYNTVGQVRNVIPFLCLPQFPFIIPNWGVKMRL